jgi:hypothetical protein
MEQNYTLIHKGGNNKKMFQKARGWLLATVFSIVGTATGIQFGFLGPSQPFLNNLLYTAVIWVGSRVLSWVISRY